MIWTLAVRQNLMDPEDPSPLLRFVVAKRSISSIFDQLLDFVKDGSAFMDGQNHTKNEAVGSGSETGPGQRD